MAGNNLALYKLACLTSFLIPSYYAHQAATVFLHAETLDDTAPDRSATQVDVVQSHLQAIPIPSSPPRVHLSTFPRDRLDAPLPDLRFDANPGRSSLDSIQNKWVTYVEHCCHGWRVIIGITTTCLLASPPFLQISPKDPIVRGLIYVFVIHLAASLASALTLVYHFRKEHFRTRRFAMAWYNSAKQHRNSCSQMPWIVLGVPAVFFCWSIIFVIVALVTSVWRGGISSSDPLPFNKDNKSMTIIIRALVSLLFLVDVGCFARLVRKLRALVES